MKKPETQVPRHPPLKLPAEFPSLLLLLFFCSDLLGVGVVRVVVACVDDGVGAGVVCAGVDWRDGDTNSESN